ncbi:MAG: cytochrome c family protein [Gemmataceae bacterium]|nr:cytochrome c family protein [Gemmataceae bacterium]
MHRRLFVLGSILLFLAAAWARRGPSAQEPLPRRVPTPVRSNFELLGAGSCAAQACHNADPLNGMQGGEYRIAYERAFSGEAPHVKDKHAQAFAVLFDERSQRIVRQWKGLSARDTVHPEREALCLRCHVHPDYDRLPVRFADGVAQFRLEDGVSCEACHGPAQRWLAAHFRPGWKNLSSARRAEFGMTDTRSLAGRVRICLDCHGGRPDAQVDHDLIAAGHPWLKFEMGDYHALWHKHWDGAKDKKPGTDRRGRADFEARLWLVGQVASAKAALDLLAARARDPKRPWPEFAEQDCFACHHDLSAKAGPPAEDARAGAPAWNAWYTAMLPAAVGEDAAKLGKPLGELRTLMASWRPDREQVAAHAREAAAQLQAWIAAWELHEPGPLAVDAMTRQLLAMGDARASQSWTTAAQWQRALSGMERARQDMKVPAPAWSVRLPLLEKALRLPPGFASPHGYDAAAVREIIRSMHESK